MAVSRGYKRGPTRGDEAAIDVFGRAKRRLENEMKIAKMGLRSQMHRLILILLAASLCGAVPGIGQQAVAQVRHGTASASLPDAPKPAEHRAVGSAWELALAPGGQQPGRAGASAAEISEQQTSQKPVGTAAAPPEGTAGITASRPAGAVIAPAKQRRSRAILIRVGLLVGAGVALGTVLALTRATPSQPPQ